MFHSLRFRLPALFLAGIALTGVVSTLIAFGLFRNYTQDNARKELRREAAGLTQLYVDQVLRTQEKGTAPPFFAAKKLEAASGDKLFYVGAPPFSGPEKWRSHSSSSCVVISPIVVNRSAGTLASAFATMARRSSGI